MACGLTVVDDQAAVRCPEVDARAKAEFKRVPKAPKGDVTKRADQEWHDANEAAMVAKNKTGLRIIDEYEKCRKGGATPAEVTAGAGHVLAGRRR